MTSCSWRFDGQDSRRMRLAGLVCIALLGCETKVLPDEDASQIVQDTVNAGDSSIESDAGIQDIGGPDTTDAGVDAGCPPSAVCPEAGSRCVGDDLVLCAPDESGCLVAEPTFCGLDGGTCEEGADGPACVSGDPCDGLELCQSEGNTCDGTLAVSCVSNDDGCLVATETDCSVDGGSCVDGLCVVDVCADAGIPCAAAGTSCEGSVLRECAANDDGCLVLTELEDCAATPGAICSPEAPARCNGSIIGDYVIRRVIDTDSTPSTVEGVITGVDQVPVSDTDRVFFRVSTDAPGTDTMRARAVLKYTVETDQLSGIASTTTAVPAGFGAFIDFDPLALASVAADDDLVVFAGNGETTQRGLYQQDGAGLTRRVDRTTNLPGSASTFVGISRPVLDGAVMAFDGNDLGSNGGVYVSSAVDAPLIALAVKGTTMPAGASGFTGIGVTDLTVEYSIFEGFGPALSTAPFTGPNRGVYRKSAPSAPLEVIADRNLPVIQFDGQSRYETVEGGFAFGAGVVFYGTGPAGPQEPLGFPQHKGIYQWDPQFGFSVVVDTATVMPNADGVTFSVEATDSLNADAFAVDGLDIYFRGVGSANSFVTRIGVYRWQDGDIEPVIDDSMTLDGKSISDLYFGRSGATDGRVVFGVLFDDGSEGVYVAYPAPVAPEQ